MSRLPIDIEEIRALAEILAGTGLTEIEVSDGDSRVRVARTPAPVAQLSAAPLAAAGPAPAMLAPVPAAAPIATADLAGAVNSPMVGVAYLSAEPGTPPFIVAGEAVAAGQTLLLIEAMKTFNQIKAPRAGTVTRICITSGQPVEYGEVLVVID